MVSGYISSDIVSILLFVSPGFITIALTGKLYGITIKMEQFERTVWSLIASVPIGILFFYFNGINEFDAFLNYFISHPFLSLFEIVIFSVILAIASSVLFSHDLLEKISQKLIHTGDSVLVAQSVWDGFMVTNFGKPVIVKTQDLEYKGWLYSNSMQEEKREIVLDKPVIIYTDNQGNTEDFPCGEQIILFGEQIKSIIVLESKPAKTDSCGECQEVAHTP